MKKIRWKRNKWHSSSHAEELVEVLESMKIKKVEKTKISEVTGLDQDYLDDFLNGEEIKKEEKQSDGESLPRFCEYQLVATVGGCNHPIYKCNALNSNEPICTFNTLTIKFVREGDYFIPEIQDCESFKPLTGFEKLISLGLYKKSEYTLLENEKVYFMKQESRKKDKYL